MSELELLKNWVILDLHDVPEGEGIYPTVAIESLEHLAKELQRLSTLPDRIIVLRSKEIGIDAIIGLGSSLAGIALYFPPDIYTCLYALAEKNYAAEEMGFMCEGQPYFFEPKHLMPTDRVIEIALDLCRIGKKPGWIKWSNSRI